MRYAASELTAGRFASSSLMSRLSELLFVEAMRQYSVTFTNQDAGWLKGVADPQIGRALAAIHHNVSSPWSADSLAREVSMSRSAFVDRFTTLIGMSPVRYLTIWRLQTASWTCEKPARQLHNSLKRWVTDLEKHSAGVQAGIRGCTRAVARPAAGGLMAPRLYAVRRRTAYLYRPAFRHDRSSSGADDDGAALLDGVADRHKVTPFPSITSRSLGGVWHKIKERRTLSL